jgi:acyl-coenzyme A synthetase/AMP-(fatty) acid ligase
MSKPSTSVLDLPLHVQPDPDEFVRAAMEWHFDPATGSSFWVGRAKTLDFDPRRDVKSLDDLPLFPNVTNELRTATADQLVPVGYGADVEMVGIFESGGTTGAPKRVVLMRDWLHRLMHWSDANLDAHGFPRDVHWLGVTPTGPHIVGEFFRRSANSHGRSSFTVDLDPRWAKKLIASDRADDAGAYAEHVVDQAAVILQTQEVAVMAITPPLLERLARRVDLVDLVNAKIRAIRWGGTQLDPDSRYLYRTEVFPEVAMCGNYGSTMVVGFAGQRPGLPDDGPCVFDTLAPYVTFRVIDPDTGDEVGYGERGQIVANHISRSFFLPNNLERDLATRVEPPMGQVGDSVADVAPVARFEGEAVIEGVY